MWKKARWGIGLGISLVLILTSCGKTYKNELPINSKMMIKDTVKEITKKKEIEYIYIQLCGAVEKPGIYPCQEGDYLFSIIEKAGGLLESACFESVNQAQIVTDGQMVIVYTKEEYSLEKTNSSAINNGKESLATKVNINTADAAKLMTLSGIGEAKAAQIIEYRQKNGSFAKIEDIMKIVGIKEHLFKTIKDAICVN